VRRKISSTPSYAYLQIYVFSKEITASVRIWFNWSHLNLELVLQGAMICVKFKLLDFCIIFNNNFGSATKLCLRYASAKCGR
jgi:hypothetical protein